MAELMNTVVRLIPNQHATGFRSFWSRFVPDAATPEYLEELNRQQKEVQHIKPLNVVDSGAGDPYPYITLRDGPTFYGFESTPDQVSRYEKLPADLRENIVPEAYNTAIQVSLSYVMGHFDREDQYTIQPGDTVVDIGAHHGYYAHELSEKVGPDGHVISVEAHPKNHEVLTKNVEANGLDNVTVVNKAVADGRGTIEFYESETHSGKHNTVTVDKYDPEMDRDFTELSVECETLDSILNDVGVASADFASLTVNKTEYEVLKGMRESLKSGIAVAVVGTTDYDEILSLLDEYGYRSVERDDFWQSPIIYGMPPGE